MRSALGFDIAPPPPFGGQGTLVLAILVLVALVALTVLAVIARRRRR